MRISTGQLYTEASRNMLEGQSKLAEIQNKLSSGKNFTSLADDPVAANRVVSLKRELAQQEVFQSNIDSTRRRLELEETSLNDLNTAMDRMRELVIQAGNGTMTDSDRSIIAYELSTLVNYAAGLMNTRDAKGEYLFSGSKGTTQTYVLEGERYVYHGDASNRDIQIGSSLFTQSTDNGRFLFESIKSSPGLLTLGTETDWVQSTAFTDPVIAERYFRTTGDLQIDLDGSATLGYSYTLKDSAGNLLLDGDGNPLAENLAYDPSESQLVEVAGAEIMLGLPGTGDSDFGVAGIAPESLTDTESVVIDGQDAYTELMRLAGGEISIQSVGDGGSPETFSYKAYDANGSELLLLSVSGGTVLELTNPAGDLAMTLNLDSPAAVDSIDKTLTFVPPASATLRFERPTDNILNAVLDTIEILETPASGNPEQTAALTKGLDEALAKITEAQDRMGEATASLGSRLKSLDDSEFSNIDFKLMTESTLSAVEDLDYAAASTELAKRQLALEAAYASFAKIQGLSLFNYIN